MTIFFYQNWSDTSRQFCMAKTTILLTELMKSIFFNHKGMVSLIFYLLLIFTTLLAVA